MDLKENPFWKLAETISKSFYYESNTLQNWKPIVDRTEGVEQYKYTGHIVMYSLG